MAARSLGLAATLGLAANAFLLPPGMSDDSLDDYTIVHAPQLLKPLAQDLVLPCNGCETEKDGQMDLFLNVSVGTQLGSLELGGEPFYPPEAYMLANTDSKPNALALPTGLSMYERHAQMDTFEAVPVTGLTVAVHHPKPTLDNGDEVLELTLIISGVNNNEVYVPSVKLDVLQQRDGNLLIMGMSSTLEPAPEKLPEPGHEKTRPKCESALCQWRHFIEDKFHGIAASAHKQFGSGRPCSGKIKEMMKDGKFPHGGPFTNLHHGPGSHHRRPLGESGRPHHHHGHPKMHHGHHHHRFGHFMHRAGRFIMAVAIPILIGIAAGVLTYAIGMVVGMAIALIWIKVFRGGKRGYASVALSEDDAAAKEYDGEIEPRDSFESAPPVYEDAPAYEEKQVA